MVPDTCVNERIDKEALAEADAAFAVLREKLPKSDIQALAREVITRVSQRASRTLKRPEISPRSRSITCVRPSSRHRPSWYSRSCAARSNQT